MDGYELTAVKRQWCPGWLYRLACLSFSSLMVRQPLRGLFHRELSAREQQGLVDVPEVRNG